MLKCSKRWYTTSQPRYLFLLTYFYSLTYEELGSLSNSMQLLISSDIIY